MRAGKDLFVQRSQVLQLAKLWDNFKRTHKKQQNLVAKCNTEVYKEDYQ